MNDGSFLATVPRFSHPIRKGGATVSTGTMKHELQAEVPRGLVKHAEKKIIANDYDYAMAA